MENKSFKEILSMVKNACNDNFYSGCRDFPQTALECATQIYIAQMKDGDNNAR